MQSPGWCRRSCVGLMDLTANGRTQMTRGQSNRYLLPPRSKITRLSPTKSTVLPNCRLVAWICPMRFGRNRQPSAVGPQPAGASPRMLSKSDGRSPAVRDISCHQYGDNGKQPSALDAVQGLPLWRVLTLEFSMSAGRVTPGSAEWLPPSAIDAEGRMISQAPPPARTADCIRVGQHDRDENRRWRCLCGGSQRPCCGWHPTVMAAVLNGRARSHRTCFQSPGFGLAATFRGRRRALRLRR